MRIEKIGVEEMPISDSFVVDIDGFSHLTDKEFNASSRIYSISNHSRKGMTRGGGGDDKKGNSTPTAENQSTTTTTTALEASTTATHVPEKPLVVATKIQHQISMKKGSLNSPPPESRHGGKGFGQRQSLTPWFIHPRKLLMFFATMSSFGSVLLIYFTLSMSKLNGDGESLN